MSTELSDERIKELWASENGLEDCDMCKLTDFTKVVRFIESEVRALTSATAAQAPEPVAECQDNDSPWLVCKKCAANGKCDLASADADRYRWLRQRTVLAWERTGTCQARFDASTGKALDNLIDAARASPPKGAGAGAGADSVHQVEASPAPLPLGSDASRTAG